MTFSMQGKGTYSSDNRQKKNCYAKKNMAIRNPKDQLDNTTMHHSLLPLKIELRLKMFCLHSVFQFIILCHKTKLPCLYIIDIYILSHHNLK